MKVKQRMSRGYTIIHAPSTPDGVWHWCYQEPAAPYSLLTGTCPTGATVHNLPTTDSDIVLLLPAKNMIFQKVNYPGKIKQRSAQKLLWPQEALLLSDVEQLHVVILKHQGECYDVAAIEKTQLNAWLTQLMNWGIRPARALPDVLALPLKTAVEWDSEWLIRPHDTAGLSATNAELPFLQLPQDICCYGRQPSTMSDWQSGTDTSPLILLLEGARKSPYNLLQGSFSPPVRIRYRVPLGLAACYLLTFILTPLTQGWDARQQTIQLQNQTHTIYQHYFADTLELAQLRRQVIQHLTALENALPQPGLLDMISQHASLLNDLAPQNITALTWDGKQLTLLLAMPANRVQTLTEKYSTSAFHLQYEQESEKTSKLNITRNDK